MSPKSDLGGTNELGAGAPMPGRVTLNGRTLDRRAFLGTVGLAAGGVLAGQVVLAREARASASGATLTMSAAHEPHDFGHVDDICGHWPRYAHPIPFGPLRGAVPGNVDPVDLNFMS